MAGMSGAAPDLIAGYLEELYAGLRVPAAEAEVIAAEAEDHLRETAAAGIAIGMTELEAQHAALSSFGPVRAVVLLGSHGEAVPFRSEPHEHVLQDRLWPPKGHAAGLEWMAFCLAPFDVGIHRAEHGGDFAAVESLVQILHQLDITHFQVPLWSLRLPRLWWSG
jgi:hypothetical protein